MTLRIKICGVTNLPDAMAAVEAGADALGFMLYPKSKRYVAPETVAAITQVLPPFVARVGVFVNESLNHVSEVKERCQLDTIQLHGEESPEYCAQLPGTIIKAFRLQSPQTLIEAQEYPVSAWLLDSYSPAARGGTGETFNWSWIQDALPLKRPVIVAGGLTPENVAACVLATRPYGLDVSSGVEDGPGKKNAEKMTHLIRQAQQAAQQIATSP